MRGHPDGLTHQDYLGDGAYVGFDGYHVVLYTSDGISYTRPVYMEPNVVRGFQNWLSRLREVTCQKPEEANHG